MTGARTLILLPGLLCDARLWRPQAAALSGLAEVRIADMTRDDSLGGMAARVLRDAPPSFALAGLSMGGYAALELMRQAPERVERLALLDTSARADTAEQTARRRDLLALVERGEFRGVSPRLLPLFVHRDRLEDEALVAEVTAMAEAVGKEAFVRQQEAIIARPDSRPGLGAIDCPTLVLCGRQDALTPLEMSEEIAALIPGAKLCVVEDCGHLSTMERPDAVNAAMRGWLSR